MSRLSQKNANDSIYPFTSTDRERPVVVIGSAHLDIYAEAQAHFETIDKPGNLDIEVGGTGYNIAVNLRQLGRPVILYSALNDALPMSSLVRESLADKGISFEYENNPELGHSGFSSHLVNGDMVSAVAAITLENHSFSRQRLKKIIGGARLVIVESNVNTKSIDLIGRLCVELSVPLAVALVSESKGLRLLKSGILPRIVFGNATEYDYLASQMPEGYRRLLQRAHCFITRGYQGVDYVHLGKRQSFPSLSLSRPQGQFSGAGDAFAAGVINHLVLHPGDYTGAIDSGQGASAEVIGRRNANLGDTNLVASHMAKLEHSANADPLTGLINRRGGQAWFERCLHDRREGSLCIIMVDIDHFKKINDTFGHSIGDLVIKAVAGVISRQVRSREGLASRWGGEEFLIGLSAQLADAEVVAERICEACRGISLAEQPELDGRISVSIGVSSLDREQGSVDSAINEADEALYRAKSGGRNRVEVAA